MASQKFVLKFMQNNQVVHVYAVVLEELCTPENVPETMQKSLKFKNFLGTYLHTSVDAVCLCTQIFTPLHTLLL